MPPVTAWFTVGLTVLGIGSAPAERPIDSIFSGGRSRAVWKINTHLFAANKARADAVNDGMVTIPPFGEIPVSPAALQALRAYPAAYRAGVIGPDLFPDMIFGGWIIHSDTPGEWTADAWLRHVWSRAWSWPDPSERSKALAFAYGFLTHGAGDIWAHSWVNQKADGAWVSFTGKERSTAIKHVVLEGYVGEHTPKTDLGLDVWPGFVSNVLIRDENARRHSDFAKYYQKWLDLYDWLDPLIDRARKQMNENIDNDAPYWAKCALHPVACAKKEQMETWQLDIKRGFRAMVDSSQSLGEYLMEGEGLGSASAMTGWMVEWIPKMFGAHAIGEGAAALNGFLSWVGGAVAPISEAVKEETERFFKKNFATMYDLYLAARNPATYMDQIGFPPGTRQQVDREMGISGGGDDFSWTTFEPIYNSVVLSKLVLLDGNGLNELARRAGMSTPLFPASTQANLMLGVFRSMTHSYQWTGEIFTTTTAFGICGPENGDPLPKTARCGIAGTKDPSGAGFRLWQHPEAKEKIFGRIFKGYGPGPGSAERIVADPDPAGPGPWPTGRALRLIQDQVDYMREILLVMREKIPGVARQVVPSTPGSRSAPPSVGTPVTNWGERCCARDLAELRAALQTIRRGSGALQSPAGLGRLGRQPSALQIGPLLGQVQVGVDRLANSRDAGSAGAQLGALSRQLEQVARLVNGIP